jgi:hypothetical protein
MGGSVRTGSSQRREATSHREPHMLLRHVTGHAESARDFAEREAFEQIK